MERRRLHDGSNVLAESPPIPVWKRLLSQFHNLVIWILIAAAVISGVMAEWADTLSILAIVLLNGILGFVQEGLPALALGMDAPERDIMQRPPRPPEEPVLTRQRGLLILFHGTLVALAAAIGFWIVYQGDDTHLARARTVAFSIMAFSQLFFAIGCRSQRYTMPELGLFSNQFLLGAIVISGLLQLSVVTLPFAQPVFEVATHLTWEWLPMVGLSLAPVTVIEVWKLVRPNRPERTGRISAPGASPSRFE